jgi:hypothetical protein
MRVPFRHRLAPGDYRLRLTVTSADCAGTAQQETTLSRLVRVTTTNWTDLEPPRTQPLIYTEDCCLPELGSRTQALRNCQQHRRKGSGYVEICR